MDLQKLQELNDLRLTIEMYNDLMDKYDDEDFVLENLDNSQIACTKMDLQQFLDTYKEMLVIQNKKIDDLLRYINKC
ncbi:hypothetical protein [Bacillus thuringiensis]|uniref:hypothetical protein n=1 Tax=Bacillus thuringiensis TaxID=1428 RepID=UPI001FB3D778|nr:hypothetical protein [Bacillus thuringiensis]UOB66686.1 hypothetical protein MRQ03_04585 [Bacillus thuringiensis]